MLLSSLQALRYKAYRDSMTTNSYPYDDKFLPVWRQIPTRMTTNSYPYDDK